MTHFNSPKQSPKQEITKESKSIKFFVPIAVLTIFMVFVGLLQIRCSTVNQTTSESLKNKNPNRISIMTYNVENLFDTEDDEGKNDEEFLPLSKKTQAIRLRCKNVIKYYEKKCLTTDWSKKNLRIKMERLADAILKVNNGRGPDILIMQEVENKNVLEDLRKNYLQKAQYKESLILEGPDRRGIDPAVLTRLDVSSHPKLHKLKWKNVPKKNQRPTRGILEVNFKLDDNTPLNVFALHLPSPRGPHILRKEAVEQLNVLVAQTPAHHINIAAGDFNVTAHEDRDKQFFSKIIGDDWLAAHRVGCKKCKGTYYYHKDRTWSFLDTILFSKNLGADAKGVSLSNWKVDPKSIYIPKESLFQVSRYLSPARFSPQRPRGVSDHWPLYMEIIRRSPSPQQAQKN